MCVGGGGGHLSRKLVSAESIRGRGVYAVPESFEILRLSRHYFLHIWSIFTRNLLPRRCCVHFGDHLLQEAPIAVLKTLRFKMSRRKLL